MMNGSYFYPHLKRRCRSNACAKKAQNGKCYLDYLPKYR